MENNENRRKRKRTISLTNQLELAQGKWYAGQESVNYAEQWNWVIS